jgi:tetratricopeptide (TPR) repeat protein
MSRLSVFLGADRAARRRVTNLSMLLSFVVGFAMDVSRQSFHLATSVALSVLVATYIIGGFWYCKISPFGAILKRIKPALSSAAAAAGIATIAALAFAPIRNVEASFLEKHISKMRGDGALTNASAESIANSLRAASIGPVPISRELRVGLQSQLLSSDPHPAVTALANALRDYNRALSPPRRLDPKGTPAERAYLDATIPFLDAYENWPDIDLNEAAKASEKLTNVISLAGENERDLKIDALMDRAELRNASGDLVDGLADAEEARKLGVLDLPRLIVTESYALRGLGGIDNLKRAIALVNLGLQIEPPQWVVTASPLAPDRYFVQLLYTRGRAYAGMGDQRMAIKDFYSALALVPPQGIAVSFLSRDLIIAQLKLGDVYEARRVARNWDSHLNNSLSASWREAVESDGSPASILGRIEELNTTPK